MADIFLSYSREDQVTARRFAEALEQAGFSVWWDQTLRSGEAYFMYKPEVVMATSYLDWEGILPPDKRQSRALMTAAATDYFAMFTE